MATSHRTSRSARRIMLVGDQPGAFATARYVRITPMKARRVVDIIRGLDINEAIPILQHAPYAAARTVLKVLESAVANAERTEGLTTNDLVVTKVMVDEGPTMKRWRPRAQGRATRINKRTSHITVVVQPSGFSSAKRDRNPTPKRTGGQVAPNPEGDLLYKDHGPRSVAPTSVGPAQLRGRAALMNGITMTSAQNPLIERQLYRRDGLDPVTIEFHADFVLVSWPTHLAALGAVNVLARESASASSGGSDANSDLLYVGRRRSPEEAYRSIDWPALRSTAKGIASLRLELASCTLIWREALAPDEASPRFIVMQPALGSDSLRSYLTVAAPREVRDMFAEILGNAAYVISLDDDPRP